MRTAGKPEHADAEAAVERAYPNNRVVLLRPRCSPMRLRRTVAIADRRCTAYNLGALATIEQAEIDRSLERAAAGMSTAAREAALADRRDRPLEEVIAHAGHASRCSSLRRWLLGLGS